MAEKTGAGTLDDAAIWGDDDILTDEIKNLRYKHLKHYKTSIKQRKCNNQNKFWSNQFLEF